MTPTWSPGAIGRADDGHPSHPHIPDLGQDPKWTWSCRTLEPHRRYRLVEQDGGAPRAGDVAVVSVIDLGQHERVSTLSDGKQRLYPGDPLVGVFGNRYATDAFEAEVRTTEDLHILTDAGMIGTVLSRHREMKRPTAVRFVAYLADDRGQRVNLKTLNSRRPVAEAGPVEAGLTNVLLIIGTAMNSGKTTVAAKLVKSLLWRGARVAACKLTGSVCQNDQTEMRAAGAHDVRDFSDYGFPSTYLAAPEELLDLFHRMTADAAQVRPDIIVMEIADGLLQRETALLLGHEAVRRRVGGVVLAAPCAASALLGLVELERLGHRALAVSGLITNSPLAMKEVAARSSVPIKSSVATGDELAEVVLEHVSRGAR